MFSNTLQISLLIFNKRPFYSNFSLPGILFEEMEPIFVIQSISIVTDDDIIHIGDDVNIFMQGNYH